MLVVFYIFVVQQISLLSKIIKYYYATALGDTFITKNMGTVVYLSVPHKQPYCCEH